VYALLVTHPSDEEIPVTTTFLAPADSPRARAPQRFAGLAGDLEGVDDDRPPLVLLHGFTFDRTMWGPALEHLRGLDPGRRVLTLDLPGHGGSTGAWAYDGESVGTAVAQAVRAAGLEAPVVVGHSYSGILATVLAARVPTRGVVNVDQSLQTQPFADLLRAHADQFRGDELPPLWTAIAASMHMELLPEPARELLTATCSPRPELLRGYWGELLDGGTGLATRLDAELARVRAADVPYLVVSADEPGEDYRRWLRTVLPRVELEVWPASAHFPHLAHPDRFADLLAATGDWAPCDA
jgi:pimeloyl-ACP methyl ester carboxylesterase